jgi:hypothetical protein
MDNRNDLENFSREAIPLLERTGELKRVGYTKKIPNNPLDTPSKKNHSFIWILLVAILGLSVLGIGYYSGSSGWFKSNINQNVTLEPLTNVSNAYDFQTLTENDFDFRPYNNHTIIVNIPEGLCP